jgi:hypothetical protein
MTLPIIMSRRKPKNISKKKAKCIERLINFKQSRFLKGVQKKRNPKEGEKNADH